MHICNSRDAIRKRSHDDATELLRIDEVIVLFAKTGAITTGMPLTRREVITTPRMISGAPPLTKEQCGHLNNAAIRIAGIHATP